jgi:hypothetical protein
MRLVKVNALRGEGSDVAKIAFGIGINQVGITQSVSLDAEGEQKVKDSVDIETSTPKASEFLDRLLASDFYKLDEYTINVRQPGAIISKQSASELTVPFVEPAIDILEDLWQFVHITTNFLVRNFIASRYNRIAFHRRRARRSRFVAAAALQRIQFSRRRFSNLSRRRHRTPRTSRSSRNRANRLNSRLVRHQRRLRFFANERRIANHGTRARLCDKRFDDYRRRACNLYFA